jgi:hypothetical protein
MKLTPADKLGYHGLAVAIADHSTHTHTVIRQTVMAGVGRNDPCPCGSGHKYKRCCLAQDQAAEHIRLSRAAADAAAAAAAQKEQQHTALAAWLHHHDVAAASRAASSLCRDGELDAAEQAAQDLLVRFPTAYQGHAHLGMVYEARGLNAGAAECYRRALACVLADPHPNMHGVASAFHRQIARLEAGRPTQQRRRVPLAKAGPVQLALL